MDGIRSTDGEARVESSELLGRITDSIHAGRSFGPAIEHDGCVVVPVAYVFGGGGGGSQGPTFGEDPHRDREGSGGGFGYVSWPIGAYVIRDGDVRFRPVVDIGGLVLMSSGLIRALRPRRRRHRRAQ